MDIYLIMVVALFALGASDLIVGVSNDAVNFLNSAIGAKVASFKTVILIAALGIIVGATFSSGMMEVARKGIMNPQYFHFSEIMLIFMAVMITDIILLDLFNTFGMPTSTTVSVVFELLGASVSISMFKLIASSEVSTIATYINSSMALTIIGGILLSVFVAFIAGAIVQYFSRMVFTFDFSKRIKYIGAIWGGFAITAITYFILIKGIKDSTYASYIMANIGDTYKGAILTEPVLLKKYVVDMSYQIIGFSFIGWTVILQLLFWITKLDIMKMTVLVGTFALAMAFAGNDLVNFIGVPLAGFASYTDFINNPGADPNNFLMTSLTHKTSTPAMYLVIAGLIMVITLWTSKKARRVLKTSLDLSRQDEGDERFGASPIARSIVRASVRFSNRLDSITPAPIKTFIDKQFDQTSYNRSVLAMGNEAPAFDMLRASVNLVMASILISIATSYKLPLSTTYVTFMVAMGTSLADRAWGRESAVFRITGVLSVILGWFFTAFVAFTTAFLVAAIIHFTGIYGIFGFLLLTVVIIFKTSIFSRKTKQEEAQELEDNVEKVGVIQSCNTTIIKSLNNIKVELINVIDALIEEDRKKLRHSNDVIKVINKDAKRLKKSMHKTISKLNKESVESGHFYVQVLDYLRELAHSIDFISQPAFDHVENNHKSLSDNQKSDLLELQSQLVSIIDEVIEEITISKYNNIDTIISHQQIIIDLIRSLSKKHIKRIKEGNASTKASLLYFSILHESNNILLQMINLLKSHRDFMSK